MNNIKKNFIRLAGGNFGLAKTYWVYGVLVGLMAQLILGALLVNNFYIAIVFWLAFSVYKVAILTGVWRAANNYIGRSLWRILAKIATILGALNLVFHLILLPILFQSSPNFFSEQVAGADTKGLPLCSELFPYSEKWEKRDRDAIRSYYEKMNECKPDPVFNTLVRHMAEFALSRTTNKEGKGLVSDPLSESLKELSHSSGYNVSVSRDDQVSGKIDLLLKKIEGLERKVEMLTREDNVAPNPIFKDTGVAGLLPDIPEGLSVKNEANRQLGCESIEGNVLHEPWYRRHDVFLAELKAHGNDCTMADLKTLLALARSNSMMKSVEPVVEFYIKKYK